MAQVRKPPLWQSIANDLRHDISVAGYRPGDKLPTEATLATRFGVNRHTVRRAIAQLVDEGLVHARRGAGVFVTVVPTDYPIGERVRFHQNLLAAGRAPNKKVLFLDTRSADPTEAEALDLAPGDDVHVYEGLSFADDTVIAFFRSAFPAARFPGLPAGLRIEGSVTRALAGCGVDDYIRATTRIMAKHMTATQAVHLQQRVGDPVLHTVGVNTDLDGQPIEYGQTWFSGDRVTLVLGAKTP